MEGRWILSLSLRGWWTRNIEEKTDRHWGNEWGMSELMMRVGEQMDKSEPISHRQSSEHTKSEPSLDWQSPDHKFWAQLTLIHYVTTSEPCSDWRSSDHMVTPISWLVVMVQSCVCLHVCMGGRLRMSYGRQIQSLIEGWVKRMRESEEDKTMQWRDDQWQKWRYVTESVRGGMSSKRRVGSKRVKSVSMQDKQCQNDLPPALPVFSS